MQRPIHDLALGKGLMPITCIAGLVRRILAAIGEDQQTLFVFTQDGSVMIETDVAAPPFIRVMTSRRAARPLPLARQTGQLFALAKP
jgi:hypothetical protein